MINFNYKEDYVTICKMITSHELARELLNRPNGFITANHGDKEFYIDAYKRVITDNENNKNLEWTLNLKEKKWR